MNKLISVALLTLVTTPSMAKTKVYGEMHASYDKLFMLGAETSENIALNNSIIGVKGSTEVKKDVSFVYQISWGVGSAAYEDKHNSGFDNRNQVIGFASPSGAFIVGRFDTPFKTLGRKADLFWSSQLGQNRNLTNAYHWDLRADKVLAYQSPVINGFQASVAYASDITVASQIPQKGSLISVNGFYRNNKFQLGAAYEQHELDASSASLAANTDALRFSAAYKNRSLQFVGFFQKENNDTVHTAEPNATVLGVGVAYKKDKGIIKAQFYTRDTDASTKNTDLIALGYDYKVTKQTDIYAQAVKLNNAKQLGVYKLGNENTRNVSDAHGISVGIRYKF